MGGSQEKYMAAPCTPKDVHKKNMFTRKCYVHNKTAPWRNVAATVESIQGSVPRVKKITTF